MHFFRLLDHGNVEVDDHGRLATAYEHAEERLGVADVDFLVRDIGRDVNEIARTGFGDEFERVAPAHAGVAADDVKDALDRAVVVVGAGLGLGMDDYGAGPQFFRSRARG